VCAPRPGSKGNAPKATGPQPAARPRRRPRWPRTPRRRLLQRDRVEPGGRRPAVPRPDRPTHTARARRAHRRRRRPTQVDLGVEAAGAWRRACALSHRATHDELCRPGGSDVRVASANPARAPFGAARPDRAGRPPTWGGTGRRQGRTAARRCGGPPCRSTARGRPARAGSSGLADLEQGDPSTRTHHPGQLGEERGQLDEVAKGEPTGDAVDRAVGNGQAPGCRLAPAARRAGVGEHAEGEVDADGSDHAGAGELAAEVAGAGRQVEHDRARFEVELANARRRQRTSSPKVMMRLTRS
jgi:hypothetical protein